MIIRKKLFTVLIVITYTYCTIIIYIDSEIDSQFYNLHNVNIQ